MAGEKNVKNDESRDTRKIHIIVIYNCMEQKQVKKDHGLFCFVGIET
jgi:hypothetical protein